MKFKFNFKILMFLVSLLLLSSCGANRVAPITGRKYKVQENLFSDAQMLNMVKSDYQQYLYSLGGDSKNIKEAERVNRVASKLIASATDYLRNNGYEDELQFYEWEVHLVPASGQINATCMPGGKITVYEGILPLAQNDAGLAAILGHEIGHAIAHHTAERFSKDNNKEVWQQLGALGIGVAGVATGGESEVVGEVVKNSIELSNGIMRFVETKYSRKQEYEADHIGIVLMAMAGYDPNEAPKLWERMTQYLGDYQMRILDDHPSNKNRMKKMRENYIDEAMSYYNKSRLKEKPNNSQPLNASTDNTIIERISEYEVTARVLNVRTVPSVTGSKVLGGLKRGQIITVSEIKDGWAKIIYNGKPSYVKSEYIRKCD